MKNKVKSQTGLIWWAFVTILCMLLVIAHKVGASLGDFWMAIVPLIVAMAYLFLDGEEKDG